ncbi:MAG: hypothetical protein H8E64_03080 [Candidatus Marinimicrobia bacterium]|nr:hypothetical protein [Candidatus Neomarinimicrobiota bacterium]
MNESLSPLAELENKIKILVEEFQHLKEKTSVEAPSITTSNKLARIEERVNKIIQYLDEM